MLKQKTVYFREEDLEAWEQIENKAEWLHENLVGKTAYQAEKDKEITVDEVKLGTCKNGHPLSPGRDKCMGKGCKYSVYAWSGYS